MLYTDNLENKHFQQFKGKNSICAIESNETKFVVIRDGDRIEYSGDLENEDELKNFVDTNKISYLPELSQETYGALAKKNITTLVVSFSDPEQMKLVDELRSHIKEFPESPIFNIAYINGDTWERYIETFKPHSKKDYPFILVINPNDDKTYWSKPIEGKPVAEVIAELHKEIEVDGVKPVNKDEL